jgi:hypothetical protein
LGQVKRNKKTEFIVLLSLISVKSRGFIKQPPLTKPSAALQTDMNVAHFLPEKKVEFVKAVKAFTKSFLPLRELKNFVPHSLGRSAS